MNNSTVSSAGLKAPIFLGRALAAFAEVVPVGGVFTVAFVPVVSGFAALFARRAAEAVSAPHVIAAITTIGTNTAARDDLADDRPRVQWFKIMFFSLTDCGVPIARISQINRKRRPFQEKKDRYRRIFLSGRFKAG
ncbi:MAG TPA: hypothetical protein VMV69_15310 [Pirellulales bacterium]|nr:hypothetical protein [Pirellulales bacterium]